MLSAARSGPPGAVIVAESTLSPPVRESANTVILKAVPGNNCGSHGLCGRPRRASHARNPRASYRFGAPHPRGYSVSLRRPPDAIAPRRRADASVRPAKNSLVETHLFAPPTPVRCTCRNGDTADSGNAPRENSHGHDVSQRRPRMTSA
jgi:hypothetical protein